MLEEHAAAAEAFARLVEIMRRLRQPDGCPWDRQQDSKSLRRYVLEEAYEVVQAIDDDDRDALVGELGDLLLQIVFLSQVAAEEASFDVEEVITTIYDKLVRRHPHVFGDRQVDGADEVLHRWEMMKLAERGGGSVIDDLPATLPALARAEKLGRRAKQIGFDWPDAGAVLDKVREEVDELEEAMRGGASERSAEVEDELGDLLFAVANLARHLGFSPEVALRRASAKFERRFRAIEPEIASGKAADPETMDSLWNEVKDRE